MYQAPVLEKFGSFRQLTLGRGPNGAKNIVGQDLVPGIGLDCDANAPAGDPRACIRS